MDSLRPALNVPRLLTTYFALLQVRKLPEVVHRVQITNLDKPSTNPFHDLAARFEATAPMSLPLQEISGVKSVGSKLEDTAEATRRGRWPERKLLHEGRLLAMDQGFELPVKLGEFWELRDGMERGVVACVALIFPYVN